MNHLMRKEFNFLLENEYSFQTLPEVNAESIKDLARFNHDAVTYDSPKLRVTVSYNDMDEFESYISFHEFGPQEISILLLRRVIVPDSLTENYSWIDSVRNWIKMFTSQGNSSWIEEMKYEASFLKANFHLFRNLSPDIFEDLCSLRFWHASEWRKDGKFGSVALSQDKVEEENARVTRIQKYFQNI